MMETRDAVRFIAAFATVTAVDFAMKIAFDVPLNEGGSNEVMAVGYTIVCAIRERLK